MATNYNNNNASADPKQLFPLHADEPQQLSVHLIQSCHDVATERADKKPERIREIEAFRLVHFASDCFVKEAEEK